MSSFQFQADMYNSITPNEVEINKAYGNGYQEGHKDGYDKGYDDAKSKYDRATAKWIFDKKLYNWKCSRCDKTPKTIGYVGNKYFMQDHFKFCNHCGASIIEVINND